MAPSLVAHDPDRDVRGSEQTARATVSAATLAVLGAAIVGALTSFGQQYLPPAINSLANSAGGWTMFVFLIIWAGKARPLLGGILGIVAYEALNASYAITSTLRGYPSNIITIWTIAALVAGPILGAGASLVRYGSPSGRILGMLPLSLVLIGEGIESSVTVATTTGITYWVLQIVLGVAFFALAAAGSLRERARVRRFSPPT